MLALKSSLAHRARCTYSNKSPLVRNYSKQAGQIKVELPKDYYKLHRLTDELPKWSVVTREELLDYYKEMNAMRRLEYALDAMYKRRQIQGFLHLYDGQEAIISGFDSVLTPEDSVITAYRDHPFMITRRCGGTLKEVFAELMGRTSGCSRGKGGSMHLYKAKSNFYGGNGIVGAQVPLGTGLAFANKYKKNGRVAMIYMGDGAANQGQVYESFNMAYLWRLPAIYVVENNLYGMGTPVPLASATSHFYTRGDYMSGILVDGTSVLSIREVGKFAINYVNTKKRPLLIEVETYRYHGHSISDPGTSYRTRMEVQEYKEKFDCIHHLKSIIINHKVATEEEISAIEDQVGRDVKAAQEEAANSPEPQPVELFEHVYAEKVPIRAVERCESYKP
ncbi:pyruvate dehydrogenase E1 component subunit alpha, mitochondrial-like isoform X2 [Schistocerca gregaria]|uniref:pyruvate dehydrogenase E1 component subunit alpha, mitochondrial-like isoform X2 n=1 Tax=Schistocerca gregaria TaxID=7010 RepID=UPI00211E2656|nr:pyruvate dehydrogenase E1 component subunit alpha, mitochondrial-like isoform X2 [Schistocerca gregaria]